MDNDGYISNGELFQVLKMMVGNNLKDTQLQQIVDKTICFADKDEDGKISFEEFCTVCSLTFLFHWIWFPHIFLLRSWETLTSTRKWLWMSDNLLHQDNTSTDHLEEKEERDDMWMTSATYSLCAYIYFCDFCGWKPAAHILPVKTKHPNNTQLQFSYRFSHFFVFFVSLKSLH